MKNLIIILTIFFVVLVNSCVHSQKDPEFKTPEAVVNYFVDNIKTGNIEGTLKSSAYYYDTIVTDIDPKEFALLYNALGLSVTFNLPEEYKSLIKIKALYHYSLRVQMIISSLLLPELLDDFLEGGNVSLSNNDQLLDIYFSSLKDIKKLESFELIRMDISSPKMQFSDLNKQGVERQKKIYKFDERIDYSLLYKFDNKYYAGGLVLSRYGSNWYIHSLSSVIARQSIYGKLEQISGLEEYLYILTELMD